MSPAASIIIPCWNGEKYLRECLDSLLAQTCQDFEALLIDDGSTDDSVPFVRGNYPRVKVFQNPKRIGYAASVNVGIRNASGRYVVILAVDITAEPDWLSELVRAAEADERIGGVADKRLLYDHPQFIDSAGGVLLNNGRCDKRGHFESGANYQSSAEIFSPDGHLLYRRRVFEELGMLDEDFQMYGEDADMAWRMRRAGWRSVYTPRAIGYHKVSVTAKGNPSFHRRAFYLLQRNVTCLFFKDIPLAFILRDFHWMLLTVFFALLVNTLKGQLPLYLKAKWDGLCKTDTMLKKRWRMKRRFPNVQLQLQTFCSSFISFNVGRWWRYHRLRKTGRE